uniref:Uncharacterized protein n=1 Tax=Romanomermis culicivorax TaxID=13658 RepID=A0A915I6M5_ROMCU
MKNIDSVEIYRELENITWPKIKKNVILTLEIKKCDAEIFKVGVSWRKIGRQDFCTAQQFSVIILSGVSQPGA